MVSQKQSEARFAHRRPRCNHDEILFLKARSQRIQAPKSRRHARDDQIAMLDGFGLFQYPFRRMLDVFEALANPLIGQSEDGVLGMIENVLRLVFFSKSLGGNFVSSMNQLSKQ